MPCRHLPLGSLLVLCLLFTSLLFAADPFSDPLIQQVQTRHEAGVQGDKKEVIALVTDLEKWTKEQPDNQLLRAYLGSTYTLRSRDIFPGPSKLRFLKDGLKTMDAAVEAKPKDVAVRFIRAVNNFNLPAFINRRDNAREDFKVLIAAIADPATAASLNQETLQAIHYYAGMAYKQLSERETARKVWNDGAKLNPTSALGQKITAELNKLKS